MKKFKEITMKAAKDAVLIISIISALIVFISIPFADSESPLPMAILIAFLGLLIICLAIIKFSGKFDELL